MDLARARGIGGAMVVVIEGSFRGRAWQGPTLLGSLRGVDAGLALWRPGPGRRCIWEQTLHASYWKRTILRVFDPESRVDLLRPGSNWPRLPVAAADDPGAAEHWKGDVARLVDLHEALVAAAAALPESRWHKPARAGTGGSPLTYAQYAAGGAAHDAYHCGQVRAIKRDATLMQKGR